jgi:uncharacterized membrane protein YGL010W
MLGLRAHAWICAGLFAALIGIPILGNTLAMAGVAPPPRASQLPLMVFYLTLFLAFGLSTVPVIVMTVLRVQAGNPAAAGLIRRQNAIIWTLWILIVLGAAIAAPAMIAGGFFAAQCSTDSGGPSC